MRNCIAQSEILANINLPGINYAEQIIRNYVNSFILGKGLNKTWYAHLTKVVEKKGDNVVQGQIIALSGNTGESIGPHIPLTVTDPSEAKVDPQKTIFILTLG